MTSIQVRIVAVSGALVLGVGIASARAQEPKPALGGPRVTDTGVPGEARSFGDAQAQTKKDLARPIPHVAFMRALHVVRGEGAGTLALTPDQDSRIRAVDQEFQGEIAKFRQDHQDEARDLLKDLTPEDRRQALQVLGRVRGELGTTGARAEKGPKGEKNRGRAQGTPPGPSPDERMMPETGEKPDPARAAAAREKLKALLGDAPKPMDAHAKIFAVLSADQRASVEKELARVRDEMQQQAKDRMAQRLVDSNKVKGLKKAGPDGTPAGPRVDREAVRQAMQNLPPEEREKVRNMSPEERRAYVRNLLEHKGGQK